MLAALRKNPQNLTQRQRLRLEVLFSKHPAIKTIYEKQLKIRALMNCKHATVKQARKLSIKLIQLIRN
jgi:hypothetical protein